MPETPIKQLTLTDISSALDKAIKDMNIAKSELDKRQSEVTSAAEGYNKAVDNVHMLKGQLDRVIADAIPGLSSTGRIRVA